MKQRHWEQLPCLVLHLATIVVDHGLVVVGHVAAGSLHLDPERILGLQKVALQELHG